MFHVTFLISQQISSLQNNSFHSHQRLQRSPIYFSAILIHTNLLHPNQNSLCRARRLCKTTNDAKRNFKEFFRITKKNNTHHRHHHHHHRHRHHFNIPFLPNACMLGCFLTAYNVDNQPLPTLGISRLVIATYTSISRKSRSVTIRQLSYPREYWSKFLVAGCLSSHQPTRIWEETLESGNLFSGSWISGSVPWTTQTERFKTERLKRHIKQTSLYNAELYSWWWSPSDRSPRPRIRLAPLFWKIETRLEFKTSSHVQR